MTHHFTAVIHEETFSDGSPAFVAHCPEIDVTSQGTTRDEAMSNLREAVELFLEDMSAEELRQRLRSGVSVAPLEVAA
jgi:predicted RNase H-like HicB family nuclease